MKDDEGSLRETTVFVFIAVWTEFFFGNSKVAGMIKRPGFGGHPIPGANPAFSTGCGAISRP
jgi:hypothetical protein